MKALLRGLRDKLRRALWIWRIRKAVASGRFAFPHRVQVETTNGCNMKCSHCPHRKQKRKVGIMKEDVFRKIIKECAENKVQTVALHNFGEPLLDKRMPDRIRFAKDAGIPHVEIYSNASLLDERRAEALIRAGLDLLYVSLDGLTPEEYARTRPGFEFWPVAANVRALAALKKRLGAGNPEIHLATSTERPSDPARRRAFESQWADVAAHVGVTEQMVWPSEPGAEKIEGAALFPCFVLFNEMYILCNGDVTLCCLDYEGETVLGNVEKSTLAEIYNGAPMAAVRRAHMDGEFQRVFHCRHCRYVRALGGWTRALD